MDGEKYKSMMGEGGEMVWRGTGWWCALLIGGACLSYNCGRTVNLYDLYSFKSQSKTGSFFYKRQDQSQGKT